MTKIQMIAQALLPGDPGYWLKPTDELSVPVVIVERLMDQWAAEHYRELIVWCLKNNITWYDVLEKWKYVIYDEHGHAVHLEYLTDTELIEKWEKEAKNGI